MDRRVAGESAGSKVVAAASLSLVACAALGIGSALLGPAPSEPPRPAEAAARPAPAGDPPRGAAEAVRRPAAAAAPAAMPRRPARRWPRLKPRPAASLPLGRAAPLGGSWRAPDAPLGVVSADDVTGGTQSLFADYAAARAAWREESGYEAASSPVGGPVAALIEAEGFTAAEARAAAAALAEQGAPRGLASGQTVLLGAVPTRATPFEIASGAPERRLARVRLSPEPGVTLVAWASPDGWQARRAVSEAQTRYVTAASVIEDSLFGAGRRAGVPREVMSRFANLFLYDVDFARDIRRGDRFEVVYEVHHDEDGAPLGTGDILFAGLSWRGGKGVKGYYRHEGEGAAAYFDAGGESRKRLLMKTPIEGARVTSGFGRRRHPVLGYTKQHKGVDFGARSGTPVMAAGDGVVVRADRFGSFGNYVRIRHSGGYETAYAHLKGFAKGVTKGARVRQGEVIAYVGSTGRSTGPHLHYEVHKAKTQVNPMSLDMAGGVALSGAELDAFAEARGRTQGLRARPLTVAVDVPIAAASGD